MNIYDYIIGGGLILNYFIIKVMPCSEHFQKKRYPDFKLPDKRPFYSPKLVYRNYRNITASGRNQMYIFYIFDLLYSFFLLLAINQLVMRLSFFKTYSNYLIMLSAFRAFCAILEDTNLLISLNLFPSRAYFTSILATLFTLLKWLLTIACFVLAIYAAYANLLT